MSTWFFFSASANPDQKDIYFPFLALLRLQGLPNPICSMYNIFTSFAIRLSSHCMPHFQFYQSFKTHLYDSIFVANEPEAQSAQLSTGNIFIPRSARTGTVFLTYGCSHVCLNERQCRIYAIWACNKYVKPMSWVGWVCTAYSAGLLTILLQSIGNTFFRQYWYWYTNTNTNTNF